MSGLVILMGVGLISALLSLSVALALVARDAWAKRLALYGTPFAAGVLIMAVRELIPHAVREGVSPEAVITTTLIAVGIFFFLERLSGGFHHHHEEDSETTIPKSNKAQGWLFLLGDTFHNFIDGLSLGGAFLLSSGTGIVAAVALAAHDIPQEMGEFGVQIRSGFTKRQTVIRNVVASMTTLIGAIITYQFGTTYDIPMGYLFAAVAGFFLYIVLSDIVPTIHRTEKSILGLQSMMLVVGVVLGLTVGTISHRYI